MILYALFLNKIQMILEYNRYNTEIRLGGEVWYEKGGETSCVRKQISFFYVRVFCYMGVLNGRLLAYSSKFWAFNSSNVHALRGTLLLLFVRPDVWLYWLLSVYTWKWPVGTVLLFLKCCVIHFSVLITSCTKIDAISKPEFDWNFLTKTGLWIFRLSWEKFNGCFSFSGWNSAWILYGMLWKFMAINDVKVMVHVVSIV